MHDECNLRQQGNRRQLNDDVEMPFLVQRRKNLLSNPSIFQEWQFFLLHQGCSKQLIQNRELAFANEKMVATSSIYKEREPYTSIGKTSRIFHFNLYGTRPFETR